ncbi:MAG: response regulator [Deltaproteobacteria bacterium]|jgi:two-component system chemotaxis response regulator CheY|nr:response regulator [Deltaproteobacteria bacterium]
MAYNVLIVDDSGSMRKVLLKTLRLSGFELGKCLEASNGREALDVMEGEWIDLIISDVHMPEMDGVEFLKSLRKMEIFSNTPVVFVTTEANEDRLRRLIDLGASGYIRKPFRPEEIGTLLSRIMGEPNGFVAGRSSEGCDF